MSDYATAFVSVAVLGSVAAALLFFGSTCVTVEECRAMCGDNEAQYYEAGRACRCFDREIK